MQSHSTSDAVSPANSDSVRLGLRANWEQFALLVAVNAFVGATVGIERVILPLLAEREFGVASRAAILSFIVSFGLVKAIANLLAGHMGERWGRKKVLVAGWLFALPLPVVILFAPSWRWVVLANVLLGINQGLCWSTTVIMKIDLAGPERRGFAMGLNEASGYLAVSAAAFGSGYLAGWLGLRETLFWMGEIIACTGLFLSLAFVRETLHHVRLEARQLSDKTGQRSFAEILLLTSWKDRALFSVSQAGMVNNLNDGMAWGLFPLYFASQGLSLERIAFLAALYPAVWGVTQLVTGGLSDRLGRKWMIAFGMLVQAMGLFLLIASAKFLLWSVSAVLLGLGTAMVYPTLLAAVGDVAHPTWRASAVGVYRLWRDGGYAIGALLAGSLADVFGVRWAIGAVGALTFLSGLIVATVMYETRRTAV
ncbi:MAG TPA: MFS transporter [Bryobacteraceae bacterium]|nr:MFS transporter [Bryobacteraceae bacterium]